MARSGGVGVLIGPLADERVVSVGQGHRLGRDGDVVPPQAVGIALAVPPLVVPAAHLQGVLHHAVVPVGRRQFGDEPRPDEGVALHHLELLRRQPARLGENLRRDQQLAHVVQAGGRPDGVDVAAVQAVAVGLVHQPPEQQPRDEAHVLHVGAPLAVAQGHHPAQNGRHQFRVLLLPVVPVGHKAHQLLLLLVQQEGVHDAPLDDAGHKGPADVVRRAQLEGPLDVRAAGLRRDHDDRDVLQQALPVHVAQHLEAVGLGHHHVQQQHADLPPVGLEGGHGLPAVGHLQDVEVVLQHVHQNGPVQLGVIRNEDLFLIHVIRPLSRQVPYTVPELTRFTSNSAAASSVPPLSTMRKDTLKMPPVLSYSMWKSSTWSPCG